MNSRFRLSVCLAIVLAILVTSGSTVTVASPSCNSTFVSQAGNVITVRPTDMDDTANMQCAFDLAVDAGPGKQVQLLAGTFRTKQIVVNKFSGRFTGAGADKTIVTNLPRLSVTRVDMYFNPPSATNPWPSLISFVDGDIVISDLAIRIVGSEPTTGWTIFGLDPPLKEMAIAIGILGTKANARVTNVLVEGEALPNSLYGYNLINGIYFEGFIGESPAPMSGTFSVTDSTFRRVASGAPVSNLSGASVFISQTRNEDVNSGLDAMDIVNSNLVFTHNTMDGFTGLQCGYLYNLFNKETSGSNLLIANNVCRGTNPEAKGFVLETTFAKGNKCLLVGNNVLGVKGVGYSLDRGISGCTIIGDGHPTKAINLGADNKLIIE